MPMCDMTFMRVVCSDAPALQISKLARVRVPTWTACATWRAGKFQIWDAQPFLGMAPHQHNWLATLPFLAVHHVFPACVSLLPVCTLCLQSYVATCNISTFACNSLGVSFPFAHPQGDGAIHTCMPSACILCLQGPTIAHTYAHLSTKLSGIV